MKLKLSNSEFVQWGMIVGIFFDRFIELTILLLLCTFITCKKKKHIEFSSLVIVGVIALALHAIIMSNLANYELLKTMQQVIVITTFILCYHYIFNNYIKSIDKVQLLYKYFKMLYFTCFIGLIQFFIYFISKIDIFSIILSKYPQIVSDRIIRVNSFMLEPSYLGTMIIPFYVCLFFYPSILSRVLNNKKKILIIVVSILTFSTILFLIILLLIYFRLIPKISAKIKIIILITTIALSIGSIQLIGSGLASSRGVNGIFQKIAETSRILTDIDNPTIFDALNLTSYATISNLWVALNSPYRYVGTGIGTHEQNYYLVYYSNSVKYGTNASDGYSLFNRILSEFGYLGILFYLITIGRKINKRSPVNYSTFWILLSYLCRGGNYILYGCIFFHFLYIYSSKDRTISNH